MTLGLWSTNSNHSYNCFAGLKQNPGIHLICTWLTKLQQSNPNPPAPHFQNLTHSLNVTFAFFQCIHSLCKWVTTHPCINHVNKTHNLIFHDVILLYPNGPCTHRTCILHSKEKSNFVHGCGKEDERDQATESFLTWTDKFIVCKCTTKMTFLDWHHTNATNSGIHGFNILVIHNRFGGSKGIENSFNFFNWTSLVMCCIIDTLWKPDADMSLQHPNICTWWK